MRFLAIDHVQIAIPAGGEDEARAFYGAVLGLVEVPKPTVLAVRGGAWFEAGAVRIHLGVEHDFRPAKKAHPAIAVDDLAALRRALERAGCPVRAGESLESGERIFTEDPFGNRLEFVQPSG
jgi:catechol 2,3-dioxygenase-like lactoylglutathione lyase family enzyme